MVKLRGRYKLSGSIYPDDPRHAPVDLAALQADGITIAPTYVQIPGGQSVPQYGPTVTGTPPVAYDPPSDCDGNFMSYKFQPNNNCYNYGCDVATNSFAQPGRMHGYFQPATGPTGPSVQQGAELDGLVFVGGADATIDDLQAHADANEASGHYVAYLISPADPSVAWPGDYHWVRCDDNVNFQSWSQKDGNDQVTDFDFAGQPIVNPQTANWTVNQGAMIQNNPDDVVVDYTFYAYMFVPDGGVDII